MQAELARNDRLSSQYGLPLAQLRYAHLWRPIGWLAGVVESSLVALQQAGSMSWGLAIICFTVALKVLLVVEAVQVPQVLIGAALVQQVLEELVHQ